MAENQCCYIYSDNFLVDVVFNHVPEGNLLLIYIKQTARHQYQASNDLATLCMDDRHLHLQLSIPSRYSFHSLVKCTKDLIP